MNRKEYNHQYYLKNKEKIKANVKRYKQEHPEETRERGRLWMQKYRAEHGRFLSEEEKKKDSERNKRWREENKDKVKKQRKKYYQENKDKIREQQIKYVETHRAHIRAKARAWQIINSEKVNQKNKMFREKTGNASTKVYNAIKNNKIKKEPCMVCGSLIVEAHHCDYNKPLDIMWLCKKHHEEWHRYNTPIYKVDDKENKGKISGRPLSEFYWSRNVVNNKEKEQ